MCFFFLIIRRPPRSTRTDTLFPLHDALPILARNRRDRRLLEHDLGHPDAIGIGHCIAARRHPPRQHPRGPVVPVENARRELLSRVDGVGSLDAHPPPMAWRRAW